MKKRLRFFITSLGTGGAERVLIDLLSWLDKDKYDISLLVIWGGKYKNRVPGNVSFHSVINKSNGKFVWLLKRVIQKLPASVFAKLFLKGDYDYEIAYLEGIPTAFLNKKKTGAKKIAFVHCDLSVYKIPGSFYDDKDKCLKIYRDFDSVCFVSDGALKGFEKAFGSLNNARVVHNAINVRSIIEGAKQPADKEYKTHGLKLVTVGRLAPEKNYSMLIDIVGDLSKTFKMELWIIGDGDLRKALEKQVAENHTDCVHFLGFRENPYPYLKQADLYVCSSSYEGYSTSVIEALVLRVPVLTTDCAGMKEILNNGEAGMIADNSREGLKSGLKAFLENPGLLSEYRERINTGNSRVLPFEEEYTDLFQ